MTDIIHSESKLIKYHTCYEPGISTIEQTAAFNHFSKNKLPQSSKNQQSVIMIHSHKLQDGIFMDFPKLDQVVTPYHLKTSNLSRGWEGDACIRPENSSTSSNGETTHRTYTEQHNQWKDDSTLIWQKEILSVTKQFKDVDPIYF